MSKYPDEFLGRCATCLDNAYLGNKPCQIGYGNGQPLNDAECLIRQARREYDKNKSRREPPKDWKPDHWHNTGSDAE